MQVEEKEGEEKKNEEKKKKRSSPHNRTRTMTGHVLIWADKSAYCTEFDRCPTTILHSGDGSLIRPCKYGKLKFYLTHMHTLQSKQQPF